MSHLLEVENLRTYFYTEEGVSRAVDGVSFHVDKGETLGIVGESGCGKSVTNLSLMRLIPQPPGKIVDGTITFDGEDVLSMNDSRMRDIRGNDISMIFQEPMTSLNPVFTCGNQIIEAIRLHQNVDKAEARKRAIEMLQLVGIPAPEQRVDEYPHQLSGGMRQRVMIAMALSCNPKLLIADEPTTALDVTVQAQILELIEELQEKLDMAVIMITHDLGVIAEVADRVMVMYAGQVVEHGTVDEIFNEPKHPYTIGLLRSMPILSQKIERLAVIKGIVPNPVEFPEGCRFHTRCPLNDGDRCISDMPDLGAGGDESDHVARCHYIEKAVGMLEAGEEIYK
ncbi:MAG: ATP-binding cassette domain-containing protein [Candidatus Marinimicrobia bacterium]|nr:ATP-binding cassette domain-containing protein [Candidatus Neomarinimicrobiota bacterium]